MRWTVDAAGAPVIECERAAGAPVIECERAEEAIAIAEQLVVARWRQAQVERLRGALGAVALSEALARFAQPWVAAAVFPSADRLTWELWAEEDA